MFTQITPIEKNNQRVLTTAQLAEAYGTNSKIISYNFNSNKTRFVPNKHYFLLEGEEMRAFREFHDLPKNINKIYLWTEAGALFHAKSLNSEKAWEVYSLLVDHYFRQKSAAFNAFEEAAIHLSRLCDTAMNQISLLTGKITRMELSETIEMIQQEELRAIAKDNITALLGEKTVSYRMLANTVYSTLWYEYRRYFHLDSYKNTPKYRFDEGVTFLTEWEPQDRFFILIEKLEERFKAYLERHFDDFENDGYEKLAADYPEVMEDFINAIRSDS